MRGARTPRATPLMRERHSPSSPTSPEDQGNDNPFAPPPEGAPEQPWQPRHHPVPGGQHSGPEGPDQEGQGQGGPTGPDGQSPPQLPQPPAWGSQWSSRQPGPQSGEGWNPSGNRPPSPNGSRGGPRWDPRDPVQRRARYALLSGMWAFFFALFSLPQVALLLGTLALYWGVSSLRAKPRVPEPATSLAAAIDAPPPAPDATPVALPAPLPIGRKQQTTAAVSGLVTASLALVIVAATYAFQFAYGDYYTCVDDALTQKSEQACEKLLPQQLRPLLGPGD